MYVTAILHMYTIVVNFQNVFSTLKNVDQSRINRLRLPYVFGMVSEKVFAMNPLDLVGYQLDVATLTDCLSYCAAYVDTSKNILCWSINFIRSIGACLLSSTTKRDRLLKIEFRSLFIPVYVEIYTDEGPIKKFPDIIHHGKGPPLCGLNYFGYDQLFEIGNYRSRRIIGGFSPRPYDFPWNGLMLKNDKPRCTVTVISKKPTDKQSHWAFTAKHCVCTAEDCDQDQLFIGSIILSPYTFLFGVHDTRISTPQIVVRKADHAYLYPDYGLYPKDVALLYFHKPIKFTNYVNGLCLPDIEDIDLSDLNCYSCGWGATSFMVVPPTASNVLKCIKTEIEPPTPVHRINGDVNSILRMRHKGPGFTGPYHGDSGGPIFCRKSQTDAQMILFGLVDGGTSSWENRRTTGARMTYFLQWAKDLINRRPSCDREAASIELCCRFSTCEE